MKTLTVILIGSIFIITSGILNAQTSNIPNQIHLTAVARHTYSPYPPVTGTIQVQVEIWHSSSATSFVPDTERYCEFIPSVNTNSYGEFSIDLGTPAYICAGTGPLSALPFQSGNLWYVILYDSTTTGTLIPIDTGRFTSSLFAFSSRTAEQLINVGPAPAVGSTLTWNGTAWAPANNLWSNYMIAEDRESSGNGGTSIAGFNRRILNTMVASAGTAITLNTSTNSITLSESGTYYIKATAPSFLSNDNALYIMDMTTSAYYVYGTAQYSNSGASPASEAEGVITVTSPITFILSHFIHSPYPGTGLGIGVSATPPPYYVFAKVFVQKIQ